MDYLKIYKKQTVLITGGAGAIGSNLARKLAESGAEKVIILDDLSASYEWNIPNLPNIFSIFFQSLDISFKSKIWKIKSTSLFG